MKQLHLSFNDSLANHYNSVLNEASINVSWIEGTFKDFIFENPDFNRLDAKENKTLGLKLAWPSQTVSQDESFVLTDEWIETIIRFAKRYELNISKDLLAPFKQMPNHLYQMLNDKSSIIAYDYAGIIPLLVPIKPFVLVDTGSSMILNDPMSANAHLLMLVYRSAQHVFTTQLASLELFQRLHIKNVSYLPYPYLSKYTKSESPLKIRKYFNHTFQILVRNKDDNDHKTTQKLFTVFKSLVQQGFELKVNWMITGTDLSQMKTNVSHHSLQDSIHLLTDDSQNAVLNTLKDIDAVIDWNEETAKIDFLYLQALANAKPFITNRDIKHHDFFRSPFPSIHVKTIESFEQTLRQLLSNKQDLNQLKKVAEEWFENHLSNQVIIDYFTTITNLPISNDSLYSTFKQKFMEIQYEAQYEGIYDTKYHEHEVYKNTDKILVHFMKKQLKGLPNPKILDLGCGPGSMVPIIKSIIPQATIIGVDLSSTMIQQAKELYPDVEFKVGDAESIEFPNESFDVVFCSGMLHHLARLDLTLSEIARVLKNNGVFIAREPNEDNFSTRYPQLAFAHSCLRHIIFQSLGESPLYEPEPHEFHISFNYKTLLNELMSYFYVDDFTTALAIANFYDMVDDVEIQKYLQTFESTLTGFPGLNIIFAGRKSPTKGVSPVIAHELSKLDNYQNIDQLLKHFHELYQFSNYCLSKYKSMNNLILKLRECDSARILEYLQPKHVLVCGNANVLDNFPKLNNDKTRIKFISHTQILSEIDYYQFDNVIINYDNSMNLDYLITCMKAVKEYKFIILIFDHWVPLAKNENLLKDYFEQFMLIKKFRLNNKMGLLAGKFIFTEVDFYKAYDVALQSVLSPLLQKKYDQTTDFSGLTQYPLLFEELSSLTL